MAQAFTTGRSPLLGWGHKPWTVDCSPPVRRGLPAASLKQLSETVKVGIIEANGVVWIEVSVAIGDGGAAVEERVKAFEIQIIEDAVAIAIGVAVLDARYPCG